MSNETDAKGLRELAGFVPMSDVQREALERIAARLDSDAHQDQKYEALQDIGQGAYDSIAEMVAALECDYDRLAELRDGRWTVTIDNGKSYSGDLPEKYPTEDAATAAGTNWLEQFYIDNDVEDRENDGAGFDVHGSNSDTEAAELAELEAAAGECESREDAEQRIQEDPLSIEVRAGWYTPEEERGAAEEFRILLGTGGPATRIIGDLNEHGYAVSARLQAQDWGAPWTDYRGGDEDTLLTYCRQFYFGEG